MTAIAYHHTVNDLHDRAFSGKGPFGKPAWFGLLEEHGSRPLLATVRGGKSAVCLPLQGEGSVLRSLTNWYAFTWSPLVHGQPTPELCTALARDLAGRAARVELEKLPDETGLCTQLEKAFRDAGWTVLREECDTNHHLPVAGRSYSDYLAERPGRLRTTLKRKAKKVEVRLSTTFDAGDWAAYEAIYRASWKPEEGDPALLRAFAEAESAKGHYRFGLAYADGEPVAAQFWAVEDGTAYIHKLAHLPTAEKLSPGTTLTATLLEQVIDRDRVQEVDFGTGDDPYKRDWMDAARPRWRLTCLRPAVPRNWPILARHSLHELVSAARDG